MELQFFRKPESDLESQIFEVDDKYGTKLLPGDLDFNLSEEEIKSKYPERYKIYTSLLRAHKTNTDMPEEELKPLQAWTAALDNLENYITKHNEKPEHRILRSRQFNVFEDVKNFLETGEREGYIKLPTGVGKTVLFSQITEALGLKSLIIVPSQILIGQTGDKLNRFTSVEFGKYYQSEKDVSKQVTVITYPSLIIGLENGTIKPEEYGALILDEVHKGLGEKTSEAISKFDCIKLGFTATPKYTTDRQVSNLLKHEIHSMTMVEGVKEGLINRFKSILAYTSTDLSGVKLNTNNNYNEAELEKAVNNEARNLSAVKLYKDLFYGERAVAYCSGVAHARDMAEQFKKNGVEAASISKDTSPQERDKILKDFHAGKILVLCNARVLIEGFDEPRAVVALNLHPTTSRVDAEQRGGRVLRLDPENPDKWGYVVDFIDKSATKPMITFPEIAHAAEVDISTTNGRLDGVDQPEEGGDEDSGQRERFRNINIEGLKVVVDVKEILSISKERSESYIEPEQAPEGWKNTFQISKENGFVYTTVKSKADEFRKQHAEWFKDYKTPSNVVYEHYHPDLVYKIVEILKTSSDIELAPEGWKTPRSIQVDEGGTVAVIKELAEDYRAMNPDWFKVYKTLNGKVLEQYHPDLVARIVEKIQSSKAPKGWMTASTLRDFVGASDITIRTFVEKYRKDWPHWFHEYKAGSQWVEHYSPELVKHIEDEFDKSDITTAPEGWMTASQLFSAYKYDLETIKKFAKNYKESHPDWFNKYKTRSKVAEHYHPNLIALITEWFEEKKKVTPPPEGWKTAYSIALDVNRDRTTIIKFIEKYRAENPNWFNNYKAGNMIVEHVSPDLVNKIHTEFKKVGIGE